MQLFHVKMHEETLLILRFVAAAENKTAQEKAREILESQLEHARLAALHFLESVESDKQNASESSR